MSWWSMDRNLCSLNKEHKMLDFLFAQSPYIATIISGFLAIGVGFLLLRWRKKIGAFGPRSRKKASMVSAVGCILVGLSMFFLMVLTAFRFHAPLFHRWIIWFAVEVPFMTSVFMWVGYTVTSRALKRIRMPLGRASNVPFTEQRQSYQQPGLRDEMAPPHQTSRSHPQPKEAREEE